MQKSTFRSPFVLLLGAIAAGALLGVVAPEVAVKAKPLSELFVDALRLLVKPIVFCTVAVGIAALGSLRQLSLVGLKIIVYFEAMAVLAIAAGMGGAYLFQPGAAWLGAAPSLASAAQLAVAPHTLLHTLGVAFMNSAVLQVLLCAIVSGMVIGALGPRAQRLHAALQKCSDWLFIVVGWLLRAAPLAAFGAMAWLVGHYGFGSVGPLVQFLLALYATTLLFITLLIGVVGRCCGVSLWRLVAYLREELLLVFGTSSSLAAMPKLIEKLCRLGCAQTVVSVTIPAGYSFNLTGSNIYIALGLVFLAQLYHVALDPMRCLAVLLVLLLTSKGASGVAGSAFVALAASLAVLPEIPDAGLAYLVGIERLLKCRPLANVLGNAVGCIAVAAWSGQLDREGMRGELLSAKRGSLF